MTDMQGKAHHIHMNKKEATKTEKHKPYDNQTYLLHSKSSMKVDKIPEIRNVMRQKRFHPYERK